MARLLFDDERTRSAILSMADLGVSASRPMHREDVVILALQPSPHRGTYALIHQEAH